MKLINALTTLDRGHRWLLAIALIGLSAGTVAQAQADTNRAALAEYNLEKSGLALSGYDPVAYFAKEAKPTKGDKKISVTHRGVTYRFANDANRKRFIASPAQFEPAYGGWCAYAMAKDKQVEIDPESFLIEDGRLLLFYKGLFNNTRKKWGKEGPDKLRPQADANWKKLSGEGSGELLRSAAHFNLDDGLGLAGYDPVAYGAGNARAGKKSLTTNFGGVEYRFATEAARSSFLASPATFEPQYGGWCAWAMSQGKKVAVDPTAFVRDEAGLFVFYNADKRDEWIAARKQMVRDANVKWSEINK